MHWNRLWIVALFASMAGPIFAADKTTVGLRKLESAALKKSALALTKSAKELTSAKAYDAALEELRVAAGLASAEQAIAAVRKKIGGKTGPTPETARARVAKARRKARAACRKNLIAVLEAWEKAGRPQGYARLATLIRDVFGDDPEFDSLDFAWYAPYLIWTRKADIERLERGDDFLESGWLDAAEVERRNESHSDWENPWVFDDGVHQIRTAMPLRTANRLLFYVTSYRGFVTRFFGSEWKWNTPRGKLPIFLAETQEDYQACIQSANPGGPPSMGAALYMRKHEAIGPVFFTFEPLLGRTAAKVGWETVLRDVRHEVAHQLLFESSMAEGAVIGGGIDWVSKGVAHYLGAHRANRGRWELVMARQEPLGATFEWGPFAWVKKNFRRLRSLEDYFAKPKLAAEAAEDNWIATAVTHFLLDGAGGRYRSSHMELLIDVHMGRGDSKSALEYFGDVAFDEMQAEWQGFVSSLKIIED